MYKKTSMIVILFLSLFFVLCGCQSAVTPGANEGNISGQAALPIDSFKDISGYTPIAGATVILIDSQGDTHTILTDEDGFYYFKGVSVTENSIIRIEKEVMGGGKISFMEVIPQAVPSTETFYAGIADAESTALALVIEALVDLGEAQEGIDLEEVISAPGFAQLEEDIKDAQQNAQDVPVLSSLLSQAEAIANYLLDGSCSPTSSGSSSSNSITSYKFEAAKNAALSADIVGIIDTTDHTVSLTVPNGTQITSLVATFALSKEATAKIASISQVSGVTPNDFSSPVTYTITAENDSTRDWTITVTLGELVRYVATTGDDSNEGTENSPWKTIQHALGTIPASGTIIVDDGTYSESITFDLCNKIITLKSVNGANSTIIKGDDGSATVTCNQTLDGTLIEGFTITHEQGSKKTIGEEGSKGRGIWTANGACLSVDECIISANTIISDDENGAGAGLYSTINAMLTITNSIISGNTAVNGGGLYNCGGTVTLINSTISNNSASSGGGIYNVPPGGRLILINTTVSNNSTVSGVGGGIFNLCVTTITDAIISGNTAIAGGGGIFNPDGILSITGTTISDNTSSSSSGGGIFSANSALSISGSTISGNSTGDIGGGIFLGSEDDIKIGGINVADISHFNDFSNNYQIGSDPSADQHIVNGSGDCRSSYPNNYFDPN